MKPRHSCWGFFYASARCEMRDARYEIIGVFTIELFEYGFVEGDKKKNIVV
ncbi:hypothetical protein VCHA54P489_60160 [Vibrio chagasii]|nr:hypothetical protein VCHA54P489_60160 [Vibrio chagasii]CAH7363020.1 hypothetical protein VCHA49P380_50160 [Vibrio chagasii]CAH7366805.1 hypothetical protein VCHA37P202_50062 [Vibrio chagasii]